MLILFILRFFVFHLYESPKYLMGRGRDAEAVEVVHMVAAYNGRTSNLTLEMLQEVEKTLSRDNRGEEKKMETTAKAAAMRKLKAFDGNHVRSLFATRKLAWSTSLLVVLWALIGLAFPL